MKKQDMLGVYTWNRGKLSISRIARKEQAGVHLKIERPFEQGGKHARLAKQRGKHGDRMMLFGQGRGGAPTDTLKYSTKDCASTDPS